MYRNNLVFMYS